MAEEFSVEVTADDCARLCVCIRGHACTHACHACPAQSQLRGFLLCDDGMLAGNVCRFNCGLFCLPPPGYLVPWDTGFSEPRTGFPLGIVWFLKAAEWQILSMFSQLRPLTAQWYLRDALGAVQWLQSCNLNPHECSEGVNSKPRV